MGRKNSHCPWTKKRFTKSLKLPRKTVSVVLYLGNYAGVYKVHHPPPPGGGGKFIKTFGEEFQVVKSGREFKGFLEEYHVLKG